jgi:uncharacterized hydrophobic protein (TIGR00341 family)
MSFRLVEVVLPAEAVRRIRRPVESATGVLGFWEQRLEGDCTLVRVLVHADASERVLDVFDRHCSTAEGYRLILLPVDVTLPRPDTPARGEPAVRFGRVSREELYAAIAGGAELSAVTLVMVLLSAAVAAIGLVQGNVAVVIGAMVMAPLLGPNVALALAATLGDLDLARGAVRTGLAGLALALALAGLLGFLIPIDPGMREIALRTQVGFGDVALALTSGTAAALSYTAGVPATLVGVMVAVALLPPTVTVGMLMGAAQWSMALGAVLVLATNVICVNLAGVATFLAQGIRPTAWWEAERARRSTRIAIAVWAALLVALLAAILLAQRTR